MPRTVRELLKLIEAEGLRVPDLDVFSVGKTLEEAQGNVKEAIQRQIEGLLKLGLPVPEPTTLAPE